MSQPCGVFDGRADLKEPVFLICAGDELEPDRHPSLRETAGNRERWNPDNIDAAHEPRGGEPGILGLRSDLHGHLANLRCSNGSGGNQQSIDLLPQLGELRHEDAAEPLSVEIIGSGDQAALIQQRQHVGAEIGTAFEIPSIYRRRLREL